LRADLDAWLREYNEERPHQGRWCYGKNPVADFVDSLTLAKEKILVPLPTTKAEPKPDESLRRAAVVNATA
jgi:hypothetical protein